MTKLDETKPLFSLTIGEFIKLQKSLSNEDSALDPNVRKELKDLLTIQEAAAYLDMSISTLYSMNSRRQIPFSKVLGKVYYRRSVLDAWLATGERKTTAQLRAETRKEGER